MLTSHLSVNSNINTPPSSKQPSSKTVKTSCSSQNFLELHGPMEVFRSSQELRTPSLQAMFPTLREQNLTRTRSTSNGQMTLRSSHKMCSEPVRSLYQMASLFQHTVTAVFTLSQWTPLMSQKRQ